VSYTLSSENYNVGRKDTFTAECRVFKSYSRWY